MGAFWVHTDLSVLWHQCEFPHFTQCCCSWAFMSPAQSSLRHPPNPHFIFSWFSTCISHFHLLYFSFPPSWYFQRHIFQLCWPIVQYLLMPDSEIRSSWVGLVWGGGLWLITARSEEESPQNSVAGVSKKPCILLFLVELLCNVTDGQGPKNISVIHSCKPAPNQTKSSNADIVCIRYCKPNCNIFHCRIQRPQLFQTLVTRRLVGWQDQHHWQGVGDGGRRKGGSATSIRWATARPPRASLPAQRFPGCLSNILEVRVSQFVVLQVDILCRALHKEEEGHLMCAFPTGYGKSLPMLLLGLLMPEGRTPNLIWEHQQVLSPITGSTVIIVVPLHTIEAQLVLECERLNIPAMAGSKVSMKSLSWGSFHMAKLLQISPREFDAAMTRRPKLLVCSVEFLADSQVGGVDYPICQLSFFPGAQRDSQESSCTSWNSPHCLYWWSTGVKHLLLGLGPDQTIIRSSILPLAGPTSGAENITTTIF